MNPINDAPRRSKAALAAPATATLKDERRAERVMMIYEEKYDQLCLLAIKYLNYSEVFAEDIVADVFIDALTNWSAERYAGIKNLEAFICQCVINRSKNFRYRNRRLTNIHDLPLDSLSTTNPMMKHDLDLDGMTKMLPPKQREAFSLYYKGYTHEEIVQMLQLSNVGASKNLIYYAKKKLQKIWRELSDEDPYDPGTSDTRSKEHKKASSQNNRPLSIRSWNLPKIKDLLNYLSGNVQNGKIRNAILLWVIEDKYAIEIISGLNYTLNSKTETNIEMRLKKGKEALREKLLGAIHSKNVPDNRFILNTPQTSLPWFTIEKDKQTCFTIIGIPYNINWEWIQNPGNNWLDKRSSDPIQTSAAKKARHSNKDFLNFIILNENEIIKE
ncbi:MAG: RNA polymerase sigma factor [Saprospiraceae bacterium]|nr:RNA polymerase sigma factor [Saprospiraceae bacterium]